MHAAMMYMTNGIMGSLTLMGASFQLAMQYWMMKQVKRYKRIFGDKDIEAEINAASQKVRPRGMQANRGRGRGG